jgi:hypothetical protein
MVNPFEERLKSRGSESNPFAKRQKERQSETPYGPQDTSFLGSEKGSEEDGRTISQRAKDYFTQDKFGEALAMQRKSGGYAGAPALYPKEAKEVATEVATIAAVEAAYAPLIGRVLASKAPKTLEALVRISQAGTTGASVAATKSLVDKGELPSAQELVEDGATWMAIDAGLQAAHITVRGGKTAFDFGKAVNDIAKKDNVPVTQVLKNLWQSTKNYIGQKYGRSIKSPQDILPADVEVLADKVRQVEERQFGRSPQETPSSVRGTPQDNSSFSDGEDFGQQTPKDQQYSPEEQKITASQQFLKSDFELAEDIRNTLSPLRQEAVAPERVPPVTINRTFAPVRDELDAISPHRVNNPNLIGEETSRAVKRVSNELYRENSRLWSVAEDMASQEIFERPELAESLRSIIEESPARPVAGEAKLQNFAEDLLERLERRRGQRVSHTAMSNEQLIKEIKQARAGYDYRYSGGVQGHRVNEFINAVEQELIRTSSDESRNALLRARDAHRTWASTFKDPSILPFRNERLGKPQALYNRMTSPDTYNILNEILSNDPSGRGPHLLKLAARNMLEKAIEPYLMRPKSFNPMKFERDMAKLQGIIPEEVNQSIGQKLYQLHEESLNQPARIEGPKEPSFARISEREIPGKLRTLEGLRQLKKELAQVPGGAEKYKEIAGTMGIDLLFGGQMDVPANSDRIRRMINDRNGRPYIKETLGEDNLHALDELVKKNSLEKRLLEIKESPTLSQMIRDPDILIKGSKVIWSMLKGNPITLTNQWFQLHKKISGKMKPREIGPAPSPDVTLQ